MEVEGAAVQSRGQKKEPTQHQKNLTRPALSEQTALGSSRGLFPGLDIKIVLYDLKTRRGLSVGSVKEGQN